MVKKNKIIIILFGVIAYWIAMYLYRKLFWQFPPEIGKFDISGMLFFYVAAPLVLGFTLSILIKERYGWIYGLITLHIYMIISFSRSLIVLVYINGSVGLNNQLNNIWQNYLYMGIPTSVFVIIGGLIGGHIHKKTNR